MKKFYELNGNSLWWVNGMEPTPQARQVIALMLQADQKGLSADDYDGSRWNDRLARLKPATTQPMEADAVKFDLALTVCAMRYISDLHIGKVNPKHLAFAFDDESKKYDLAEFLKDHVANGSDVAGALAQVEPPYPGYRRTIQALQTYMVPDLILVEKPLDLRSSRIALRLPYCLLFPATVKGSLISAKGKT